MVFMIELLRCSQAHVVMHVGIVSNTHEVVIPDSVRGNHEEAEEAIGQQHLDLLVVRWQVSLGVVPLVAVVLPPLEPTRSQPVRRQRHGSRRETAGDNNAPLTVPRILGDDLRMEGHILGRQLRQFVWLGVHPSKWLEILDELMLRKLIRKIDDLVSSLLRRKNDAANLLDVRIVRGRVAVEESSNLSTKIRDGDELLQQVLRQNVGEPVSLTSSELT